MVRQIKRTTEEYLREALVQLIEERPVDRVSVRMLCERAGINRSTFYRHFDCVETLVEKMSVEMCSRLVEIVTNDGRNDNILLMRGSAVRIYNDWFDYVRGSEELFRAFLGVNGPRNFYDRLFQNGIDWYDGLITGASGALPKSFDSRTLATYIVGAHMTMLVYSLGEGRKYSSEHLARQLVGLTFDCCLSGIGLIRD